MRRDVQPEYKNNNYDTKTTTMIQKQQSGYKYNNYDTNTTTRIQKQQRGYKYNNQDTNTTTSIQNTPLSWLGTGTSITTSEAKLISWTPHSEMIR